jgi:hypothetical protein
MSHRSINENLEKLIPLIVNEEMELADFVEKTLPFFNTTNSNIRNDVSVGIKEYKDKNPIPKQQQQPVTQPNDVIGELSKKLEMMEKKIQENELASKRESIKNSIIVKLNEKGVTDKEWIESLFKITPIEESFDIEEKAEEYLAFYNKTQASVNTNLTPKGVGGGGNGDEALSERMKKVAEYAKSQNLI